MFNRIIGLDVGRNTAVLCCLESLPSNIQKHYRQLRSYKQFYKVTCSQAGVDKLLSMNPTAIVLEPTGHWYSEFWVKVAQVHGIKICWVGHNDLDSLRKSYGFTNKRDEEDALCLACCYFDSHFINVQGEKRFLKLTDNQNITKIRRLFNEKEQLQKLRTNLIAQLRQRLSYEFPEASRHNMVISSVKGYTPIIYWLATKCRIPRYDSKYKQSVASTLEIKISLFTRSHASAIIELEHRITDTLNTIESLIASPEFAPYNRVFDRFGFGVNCQALLLFNLYPFEKFLVNGKPWVEYEPSNGKLQKRDRSLSKFQAFCGMSFSYRQSGDKTSRKFHGNGIIRSHLYMWVCCCVTRKIKYQGLKMELGDRYQELKKTVKGKDAITRVLFKLTRMLFYELVKEITH
jgi:Transposase